MIMHLITSSLLLSTIGWVVSDGASVGRLPHRRYRSVGITNGTTVDIKDVPFMASIEVLGWMMGSGVVLNQRWILTTAFNLISTDPKHVYTRVGSNKWITGGRQLASEEVHVHPNYTGSWDWDIALVKTRDVIKYGDKVQPATLATDNLKPGSDVTIAGWGTNGHSGLSKLLQSTKMTILGTEPCAKSYPDDWTVNLFCTAYSNYTSTGAADTGDPLYVNEKVYGLYAAGDELAPNLFVNIPVLYPWIKAVIGG